MKALRQQHTLLQRRTMRGYGFTLGAVLGWGGSQVLLRHGVSDLAPPLLGSAIALLWGTAFVVAVQGKQLRWQGRYALKGALFFAVAGILSSVGFTFNAIALKDTPVVVVAPITSVNPLVTLVLAPLLLRGLEKITPRLVLGALLVVLGVILLSLASA